MGGILGSARRPIPEIPIPGNRTPRGSIHELDGLPCCRIFGSVCEGHFDIARPGGNETSQESFWSGCGLRYGIHRKELEENHERQYAWFQRFSLPLRSWGVPHDFLLLARFCPLSPVQYHLRRDGGKSPKKGIPKGIREGLWLAGGNIGLGTKLKFGF